MISNVASKQYLAIVILETLIKQQIQVILFSSFSEVNKALEGSDPHFM